MDPELHLPIAMTNTDKCQTECSNATQLPCFLTGLGVGVAVTLLFAPLAGSATRNLLGRKVRHGKEWVKEKAAATESYVADVRGRVKEVAEVIARS